jgi:hypothetical protein
MTKHPRSITAAGAEHSEQVTGTGLESILIIVSFLLKAESQGVNHVFNR